MHFSKLEVSIEETCKKTWVMVKFWLTLFVGWAIFAACETNEMNNGSAENPTDLRGVEATVTSVYADEGCEFLLTITEEGEPTALMPLNLDNEYKIHGTKLRIEFHSSRIKQDFCQVGRPIIIDHISTVD